MREVFKQYNTVNQQQQRHRHEEKYGAEDVEPGAAAFRVAAVQHVDAHVLLTSTAASTSHATMRPTRSAITTSMV